MNTGKLFLVRHGKVCSDPEISQGLGEESREKVIQVAKSIDSLLPKNYETYFVSSSNRVAIDTALLIADTLDMGWKLSTNDCLGRD